MKNKKASYTSKGNVLNDLGLSSERTAVERLKFEVHCKILEAIKKNKLSPRDVEKILDKPQPRVSELLNGKIAKMTLDKLVSYLDQLGGEPQLKCKLTKIA
ncbi:MAG: XRE family transcriptional regulator [Oligoflexia bacterium]|nr:XRE family transcriptional regulator [Oligoflexia bacterium]